MKYQPPINGDITDPNRPYINADPARGVEGAIPPAEAIEHPQREQHNLIEASGLTPDANDLTQMTQAVRRLIVQGQRALASLAEARAGTDNSRVMTPLRTRQAIENHLTPVPVGTIIVSARLVGTPPGWLRCNGARLAREAYADLFSAIGTTFGNGDGRTTFNIPDLRGEFLRGWNGGSNTDPGRVFGSVQADEFKSHTHDFTGALTAQTSDDVGYIVSGARRYSDHQSIAGTILNHTGGRETRPRNVSVLFLIKY